MDEDMALPGLVPNLSTPSGLTPLTATTGFSPLFGNSIQGNGDNIGLGENNSLFLDDEDEGNDNDDILNILSQSKSHGGMEPSIMENEKSAMDLLGEEDDDDDVLPLDNEDNNHPRKEEEDDLFMDIFGEISDDENESEKKGSKISDNDDNFEIFGDEQIDGNNLSSGSFEEIVIPEYSQPQPTNELVKIKFGENVNIMTKPYTGDENEEMEGNTKPTVAFQFVTDPISGDFKTDSNGQFLRESNTKIVKYSDGSIEMVIGNQPYQIVPLRRSGSGSGGGSLKTSHIYCSDVAEDKYFVDHGEIGETWKVRTNLLDATKLGSYNSIKPKNTKGDKSRVKGYEMDYTRRTKLTDIRLAREELVSDGRRGKLNVEREIKALRDKQRKKMREMKAMSRQKLDRNFLEDGEDGVSINQIKKQHKRKLKEGKNGEMGDDFIVNIDDDDEDADIEYEDEDEDDNDMDEETPKIDGTMEAEDGGRKKKKKKKRRRNKKRKREDFSDDDNEHRAELVLYDDESGSDSDETYRPFKKRRKTK